MTSVTSDIPILTQVAVGLTDGLLIPANAQRKGLIIANPNATAELYITPQPASGTIAAAAGTGIALLGGGFIQIDSLKCACGWRAIGSVAGTCTVLEWV
jgi:hypothetical protein